MGTVSYKFLDEKILELLMTELNWARDRAIIWYTSKNPYLKRMAPRDFIRKGKYLDLVEYILECLGRGRLHSFNAR